MKINFALFALLCVTGFTSARKGLGPNEQEWGYITVRPKAHIFWWLHQTTAKVQNYTERPLVIWLQGGPGASSTGFGNFLEIGPLDEHLNERNTSWIQYVNVLFVDNPVGTGFSYVESKDALTINNRQIAEDFLVFLQEFYRTIPALKNTPLYIFGESYGGKMIAEIALVVHERSIAGPDEIDRLKGIMNNKVKNALNLNNTHFPQNWVVFRSLLEDIMKPVTNIVEELLNKTDIKVAVFNGQLDFIVNSPGTENWVNNLKFPQARDYENKVRDAIVIDGIVEGFHKNAGNLYMYWVNRAGHMVPADNPTAMKFILSEIIENIN